MCEDGSTSSGSYSCSFEFTASETDEETDEVEVQGVDILEHTKIFTKQGGGEYKIIQGVF